MRQQAVTVSAVLIVKDEEAVLAACLESVAWADEIVVYDTGSTDRTREIARQFTDIVVEGYWDDDFAAARNRALCHATGDWVLSIDADEVFEGDPRRLRRQLGDGGAALRAVIVRNIERTTALPLGLQPMSGDIPVTRLFVREQHRWRGALHEQPTTCLDGGVDRVAPVPGVVLLHSGYLGAAIEQKGKGDRNVALARADLDRALARDASPLEVEECRMQLARSLLFAGSLEEATVVADSVAGPDGSYVNPRHAVMLAQALVSCLGSHTDAALGERWLTIWEQHDVTPWAARAQRARLAAATGDAEAALEALAPLPTTAVNGLGERFSRLDSITVEVWALAAAGHVRQAGRVAREAAARGTAPGTPGGLVRLLGHDRTVAVIEALDDRLWREYALSCVMDAGREERTFLEWMQQVRPGDATVLGAIALVTPVLSLEEAAQWAVVFRTVGLVEQCPLALTALDELQDPRQRALAGALAFSAYGDARGLAGLEDALPRVREEDTAALLGELEVLAPGLVSAGAPA